MDKLLATRTQRNWGTDHVYLTHAEIANIWYCLTGKKTVDDADLSNLRYLMQVVRNDLIDSDLTPWFKTQIREHLFPMESNENE